MIYAHIKSPKGNREEEWEDTRLKPEEKPFLVEYNAYIIGYVDEAGAEQLGAVEKDFWDVYEEMQAFKHSPGGGTFPAFVALDKKYLAELSGNFRDYLNLEKAVFERAAVPQDELPSLNQRLDAISEINANQHNHLSVVAVIMDDTPDTSPEREIAGLIRTMYGFTVFLSDCSVKMRTLLEGLQKRADNNADYTPLDYLRDLNALKATAHDRQALEKDLTYARSAFNKLFAEQQ